ncbi:L,D-transpeptidase family protein [Ottowia sp.]|uniref:L,D-transpeptidase family protein n=1 Tax=Ottowia sp. TaxID=1898956 RepID=UPI003A8BE174
MTNLAPALITLTRRRSLTQLGAALAVASATTTSTAWAASGTRRRRAARAPVHPLRPGQSLWLPAFAPEGPVVALTNLHTQHVQLYRNGVAIGFSSTSTGKRGHSTPPGVFTVLEKRRHHRSSTYDNAPMPWMVRLTWDGIALHGGALPGYPASHGCVRLPSSFAPRLFGAIKRGNKVAIVREAGQGDGYPLHLLAPLTPEGTPALLPGMLAAQGYWAWPEPSAPVASTPLPVVASSAASAALATAAVTAITDPMPASGLPGLSELVLLPPLPPLTLLVSLPQNRAFALQAGRIVAAAPLPTAAQQLPVPSPGVFSWAAGGHWQALGAASAAPALDTALWRDLLATIDAGAPGRLRAALSPGSTLVVSTLPAVDATHLAVWKWMPAKAAQG